MLSLILLSVVLKAETTSLGEYGPYSGIGELTASSDGSAHGFVAQKPDGKWYVIVNGREHGPYEYASRPFFSDGSVVFYAAKETRDSYYRVERVRVSSK